MLEPTAERFATCCSEALFGYAEAAQAMWWAAAGETIGMCDRAIKATSPQAETKPSSWFNPNSHGQPNYGGLAPKNGALAMPSWMSGFGEPSAAAWPFDATPFNAMPMNTMPMSAMMAVSPFEVWLNMFPLRGGPAAWPMAFCMLSAGVPKAVAWPAAEANAAMMEAAEVVNEQFKTVLANYRTDSGYASAGSASGPSQPFEMPVSQLMAKSWPLSA